MRVSRALAHKLQNLIQAILGFIELGRTNDAKKKLREMSQLIERNETDCEDCDYKNSASNKDTGK